MALQQHYLSRYERQLERYGRFRKDWTCQDCGQFRVKWGGRSCKPCCSFKNKEGWPSGRGSQKEDVAAETQPGPLPCAVEDYYTDWVCKTCRNFFSNCAGVPCSLCCDPENGRAFPPSDGVKCRGSQKEHVPLPCAVEDYYKDWVCKTCENFFSNCAGDPCGSLCCDPENAQAFPPPDDVKYRESEKEHLAAATQSGPPCSVEAYHRDWVCKKCGNFCSNCAGDACSVCCDPKNRKAPPPRYAVKWPQQSQAPSPQNAT